VLRLGANKSTCTRKLPVHTCIGCIPYLLAVPTWHHIIFLATRKQARLVPPQRPPSLGPAPGIGGPFRGPYPTYALPPWNIVPGYPAPGLQNHCTTQNLVPRPAPCGFVQPRTPGFPFGSTNPHQQQSQSQPSHPQLPLPPHQQPQPPTSVHPSLSHLQSVTPSIGAGGSTGGGGTAPSVSSTSELSLDPNDFPVLGATPSTTTSTSNPTPATSYASQAGTGLSPSGSNGGASRGPALPRDFTADDFPALSGGPPPSQQLGLHAVP